LLEIQGFLAKESDNKDIHDRPLKISVKALKSILFSDIHTMIIESI